MKKYCYVARSPTGKRVKGKLQVEDEKELFDIMVKHNFRLLKYKEYKMKKDFFSVTSVNNSDILNLCENLNMMIRAGVTLKDSIHLSQEVVSKKKLKTVLSDIELNLEKGKSLYNCVNSYPNIFPVFFRTMINLAEISGYLKDIFSYLITYYRFDISIKKKIINAMFYPCLLLMMCFAVIIVMSTVIVPSFVIVVISNFISHNFMIIVFLSVLIFLGIILFFNTKKGKYVFDKLKVKIIIIKTFVQVILTSRFCKSLKILIDSGIPIVSCLEHSSELVGNKYLRRKFLFVIDEIKRGSNISSALYAIDFFPQLMLETIYISEKTANLSYALGVLGQIYEEDLHNKIQRLTSIIEPMLILFIALIVVILLIAIFIPLFSMLNNIGVY